MAPRKKVGETKAKASPMPVTRSLGRLTRSSAKRLNARLTELPTELGKKRKQGKAAESKKKGKKAKTEAETATAANTEAQVEVYSAAEEEEKGEADEEKEKDEVIEEDAKEKSVFKKTIVIEHCKQCKSFEKRAMKVEDALLRAFPSISVSLNPVKPRMGCFEIREKDGETFISLLNMNRPFPRLKALDMDQVISDIINRVKSSTKASQ